MIVGALAGNFGHGNRTEAIDVYRSELDAAIARMHLAAAEWYWGTAVRDIALYGSASLRYTKRPQRKANIMGCSKGKPAPAKTGGGKKK